jgi:poly-gamma-glutamate synthesis protein (capsule biosynthesis protein)
MFDCEKKGIVSTIEFLSEEKIKFTGAGETTAQALRPAIFNLKNTRIGFLAYNAYPMDWIVLKEDQPAIAFYDSSRAIEAVEKLKKKADVVIVSLHWGDEYRQKPNSRQIKIAHQLIDAGADLILGHHPHVLQPIEEYKDGVVVYSLGNFVFDQRKSATRKSVIFRAKLSKKGVEEFSTLPVQITDYRPCLVKEKAGKEEVAADISTDKTD